MNIDEPECLQLGGQLPGPRLTGARDLGRAREDAPDFAECTWHFIEYAEPIAFFEHENAAGCQRPGQSLQNDVPIGDMQQDESCMDEIECALGDVVGDKVELGDFASESR